MTRRCVQCDFRETTGEPLVDHAATAGHPLCVVCARSLRSVETQTCEQCAANTRADLAQVVRLYPLLRAELGHPAAQRYDQRGGSAEPQIPGGDALVMLAGGNPGHVGDLGSSNMHDTRADDPESIAVALAGWEDDWRHLRGEPPAMFDTSAGDRQEQLLEASAGYLNARLGWAAAHHPVFNEFAGDLARLASRLATTTHSSDLPIVGVKCLDCGGRLERPITRHGFADHYECPRCHRRYDTTEYRLALRAHVERRREDAANAVTGGDGWGRPWQVAALVGMPVRTVRTWAARMVIGSRCDVESKALEVSWTDAEERAHGAQRTGAA